MQSVYGLGQNSAPGTIAPRNMYGRMPATRFTSHMYLFVISTKKANFFDLLESDTRDIIEKVPSLPQCNKIGLSSGSDGANVASAFGGYKNNLGRNSSKTSEIRATFMLQTIEINGHTFNIFYDGGCGDLVVKKSAIDILLSWVVQNMKSRDPLL